MRPREAKAVLVLQLLTLVVATAGSGIAPAPDASAKPLREIGHVHASAACGNVIVHANSAIAAAISNDRALASAIAQLRAINLDGNGLEMRQGMSTLDHLAAQLHSDAMHGNSEVKRLRDLDAQTSDPARKGELQAFADALGGVLDRQETAAHDITGFLSYLDYRQMHAESDQEQTIAEAVGPNRDYTIAKHMTDAPLLTLNADRQSPNAIARSAAAELSSRLGDISVDETKAANHAESAVSGC